jgi:hypothetical protein
MSRGGMVTVQRVRDHVREKGWETIGQRYLVAAVRRARLGEANKPKRGRGRSSEESALMCKVRGAEPYPWPPSPFI